MHWRFEKRNFAINLSGMRPADMMKNICIALTIFALFQNLSLADNIKIGSYNLLGSYPREAEFSETRAQMASDLVHYRDFDVIGMQEAQFWQMEPMVQRGIYAKNGVNVCGETPALKRRWSNIILYKKEKFTLLESGTFWLSDTPEEKSIAKEWGEKQYRNCNWVKLKDKNSGKEFYFFNTHFGLSPKARLNAAKLFVKKIKEIAGDSDFFCSGDFNTPSSEKATLSELTKSGYLRDSWAISEIPPYGPKGTFICMLYNKRINNSKEVENPTLKIDYLFVSKAVKVLKCAAISDNIGGAYASDHLPIEAYVEF